MNQIFEAVGFNQIKKELTEYANTMQAREIIRALAPRLSRQKLNKELRDTTQAKRLLEELGLPPLPLMEQTEEYIDSAAKGDLLLAEQMEEVGQFLVAVKRLKAYLDHGRELQIGLAFYSENLTVHQELLAEIEQSVRHGHVDDYASKSLRDIRKQMKKAEEKMRQKAEAVIRSHGSCMSDSYVVSRSGKMCVPVKHSYRNKIDGAVIDQSSSGTTVFIEPKAVAGLREEYEILKIAEDTEERRILYTLMEKITENEPEIRENIRVIVKLDVIFAKAKMSADMKAIEPVIRQERCICLKEARHPLLNKEECVPLDFALGDGKRGVIITGPNTGGKTVAIKTVALLSLMACSGLHVPAKEAEIALNNQVLCDIGDGQNITDNLSTFSAHIKNIINILQQVTEDSLVILDELGSGTDPAEGMGIAIAILEQLRQSKALFLVTTHYPEVKEYGERYEEIVNARMAFDRESLKPLYRLELGKSGESCALYIAKRLGFPNEMLKLAAQEAYGGKADTLVNELKLNQPDGGLKRKAAPKIEREVTVRKEAEHGSGFQRGDSVEVMPEGKIGIVVKPADHQGSVLVQIQKEKILVNHKRLKLKVAAKELYPADYDFSILFDTVENRKARHQMGKHHSNGQSIYLEE